MNRVDEIQQEYSARFQTLAKDLCAALSAEAEATPTNEFVVCVVFDAVSKREAGGRITGVRCTAANITVSARYG